MNSMSFLLAACCSLLAVDVRAADVPARVLDLSSWRLTLPINTDRPGEPDEIRQPELASFVDPRWFFVNEAADGVVFRAPCGGRTTKGSKYPRSELREASGTARAAWGTADGVVHVLTATLAVTKTPPVKKHVCCLQIHDAQDDLLMVRVEGRKLLIERKSDSDVLLDGDYALGTRFDLKIEASGGSIKAWHNGQLKMDWKSDRKGCYFKAGCYTQSNPDQGDAPDSYGEVVIHRLQVVHRSKDSNR
jgi:hypothetical protein